MTILLRLRPTHPHIVSSLSGSKGSSTQTYTHGNVSDYSVPLAGRQGDPTGPIDW